MNCTLCNNPARWCENKEVYGRNYGDSYMIWLCDTCGAYVGCHKNTKTPLGTFADKETREWRMRAHEAVDGLWMDGKRGRGYVYGFLRDAFGKEIHIGESDIETCKQIIATVSSLQKSPNTEHKEK